MILPIRNLTGGQIHELMDTLLYAALKPVIENTDLFNPQLAYILSMLVSNKKRRPCNIDADSATYYLICALHVPRHEKLHYIQKLGIERQFIYMFLRRFLQTYRKPFMLHYSHMLSSHDDPAAFRMHRDKADTFRASSGATRRVDLYNTLIRVERALPEFTKVFDSVVNNFNSLCERQAAEHVRKNPNHQYDQRDVAQDLKRAVITGMNKYDSSRGAHATYLKWWMFNALTCGSNGHEYGLAYLLPQSQKKRIATGSNKGASNFSVSLDQTASNEDDEEGSSLHQRLGGESQDLEHEINLNRQVRRMSELAKAVDPYGLSRLTYDMEEVFSPHEIAQMRAHMARQKL